MINALAIAALLAAPTTAPQAPSCLPREMVSDAFIVLSPYLLRGMREGCTQHLPGSAFLVTGGEALATRLQGEGAGLEESAITLLGVVAGAKKPELTDQASVLKVTGEAMQAGLVKALTPKACAEANRMIEALAPLPGRNMGTAVASLMALGSAYTKGKGPRVCDNG